MPRQDISRYKVPTPEELKQARAWYTHAQNSGNRTIQIIGKNKHGNRSILYGHKATPPGNHGSDDCKKLLTLDETLVLLWERQNIGLSLRGQTFAIDVEGYASAVDRFYDDVYGDFLSAGNQTLTTNTARAPGQHILLLAPEAMGKPIDVIPDTVDISGIETRMPKDRGQYVIGPLSQLSKDAYRNESGVLSDNCPDVPDSEWPLRYEVGNLAPIAEATPEIIEYLQKNSSSFMNTMMKRHYRGATLKQTSEEDEQSPEASKIPGGEEHAKEIEAEAKEFYDNGTIEDLDGYDIKGARVAEEQREKDREEASRLFWTGPKDNLSAIVREALKYIPIGEYPDFSSWRKIILAADYTMQRVVHPSVDFGERVDVLEEWSKPGENYDEKGNKKIYGKLNHDGKNPEVLAGPQTLYAIAKENGWPRANKTREQKRKESRFPYKLADGRIVVGQTTSSRKRKINSSDLLMYIEAVGADLLYNEFADEPEWYSGCEAGASSGRKREADPYYIDYILDRMREDLVIEKVTKADLKKKPGSRDSMEFIPVEIENDKNTFSRMCAIMHNRSYNPWIDYLESVKDESVPSDHCMNLISDCFEFDPKYEKIAREASRLIAVGLVRRSTARREGVEVKLDFMLFIASMLQGTGKTSFYKHIVPEYLNAYSDKVDFGLTGKNFYDTFRSALIADCGEMDGIRTRNANTVKNRISETFDDHRDLYVNSGKKRYRQCVFVGSANDPKSLPNDSSGTRRFLSILVTGNKIKGYEKYIDFLVGNQDKFWASAQNLVAEADSADETTEEGKIAKSLGRTRILPEIEALANSLNEEFKFTNEQLQEWVHQGLYYDGKYTLTQIQKIHEGTEFARKSMRGNVKQNNYEYPDALKNLGWEQHRSNDGTSQGTLSLWHYWKWCDCKGCKTTRRDKSVEKITQEQYGEHKLFVDSHRNENFHYSDPGGIDGYINVGDMPEQEEYDPNVTNIDPEKRKQQRQQARKQKKTEAQAKKDEANINKRTAAERKKAADAFLDEQGKINEQAAQEEQNA